jgi:tetratricopeptide (TPR) repeat protein
VKLPASNSSQANQLEADACAAVRRGDHPAALTAFKRAVEADPKFMRARLELAAGYMASGMGDWALEVLRQAVASDPQSALARRGYVSALGSLHRTDDAIAACSEAVKITPDDPEANSALGSLLLLQKRYSEALPYLEVAARNDISPSGQARLGSAYLWAGQIEKGTVILQKIADANSNPMMLNDIAYDFAEANADLGKALEYAQHAVTEVEEESRDIDLSNLLTDDLACVQKLGYFWDTLGWVHFRLGHLDLAESYIRASWVLSQSALVGDHLGQIYEQQKKTEKAVHVYRLALAAPDANASTGSADDTRQRLEHLTGEKVAPKWPGAESSASELGELRSVKLKQLVPGSARAEFFLLFSPGPKVEDVKFISGSEELQSIDQVLSDANFQVAFPEGSSSRLLRRAIVTCSSDTGCEAVLLTPDSVTSVD